MTKMNKTIISESLYHECLDHYKEVEGEKFVVSPSLPVLFFGDLKAYLGEIHKVVTVGKNPSNHEFPYDENGNPSPQERFGINSLNYDAYRLEASLMDYFKKGTDYKWFNNYEAFLNGLGYSYYQKQDFKRSIHTDMYSPIATNPVWSELDDNQRKLLEEKGVNIWKKLIRAIKPDLLICSFKWNDLDKNVNLKFDNVKTIAEVTKYNNPNKPYDLIVYQAEIDGFKTQIVYGDADRFGPFGPVSDEKDKTRLGRACRTLFR